MDPGFPSQNKSLKSLGRQLWRLEYRFCTISLSPLESKDKALMECRTVPYTKHCRNGDQLQVQPTTTRKSRQQAQVTYSYPSETMTLKKSKFQLQQLKITIRRKTKFAYKAPTVDHIKRGINVYFLILFLHNEELYIAVESKALKRNEM